MIKLKNSLTSAIFRHGHGGLLHGALPRLPHGHAAAAGPLEHEEEVAGADDQTPDH